MFEYLGLSHLPASHTQPRDVTKTSGDWFTHLQVSVLKVSQPERFSALVESERRLDAIHERLQALLHGRNLAGQSDVLRDLRVRAHVLQHARRRLQVLQQADDVIAMKNEDVIDDRHRLTHERLDEDASTLKGDVTRIKKTHMSEK